jgi:hypothetical protein
VRYLLVGQLGLWGVWKSHLPTPHFDRELNFWFADNTSGTSPDEVYDPSAIRVPLPGKIDRQPCWG